MTKRLPPVEEQRRRTERKKRHRKNPCDRQLVKAAWRDASKAIADQAIVHRRETATLAANYVAMQNALAAAVKTIDWIRGAGAGQCWTPADDVTLEEWRKLCSA